MNTRNGMTGRIRGRRPGARAASPPVGLRPETAGLDPAVAEPCPDAIMLHGLLRTGGDGGPSGWPGRARLLLLAWIMGQPATTDMANAASRLRRRLATLPQPHPALPHIQALLDTLEVGATIVPRRRGGRRRNRIPRDA